MSNLAIERDPKSWSDFYYHERQVAAMQRWLKTNNLPFSVFISGSSGTGKTTAVRLFLRALHCQGRAAGEYELCGRCPVCQADPRTTGAVNNVFWLQRGKDESLSSQFNRALEEAFQPPNGFDDEHRFYKAVVIDEVQSIPRDRLQDLLFYPELPDVVRRNRVIFIFITMDEARIDASLCQALKDRSYCLYFRPFTSAQVTDYLMNLVPGLPKESAEMIALDSSGSLRGALSRLQNCVDSGDLSPTVVASTLMFASAPVRKVLWQLLEACASRRRNAYTELWEFWQQLETAVNPQKLIAQLDRDIDKSMLINPRSGQLAARMFLYSNLTSRAPLRAWDTIKMLQGLEIIDPEIFDDEEPPQKN